MLRLLEKERYWVWGIIVFLAVFFLWLAGIWGILGNPPNAQNILGYLVFSALSGAVAAFMVYKRWRIALVIYLTGQIVGFFEMLRMFYQGDSGWGDLMGVISLLFWSFIGIASGLALQLGLYLFRKGRK